MNITDVTIDRRSGQFGPNRVHEVQVGPHAMLIDVVGSGAIRLRASVTRDGRLRLPSQKAEWTILLASTGGGKITESIGGTHAARGLEAGVARHRGFVLARRVFYTLWDQWFDSAREAEATAKAVVDAFGPREELTAPRNVTYPLMG